MAVLKVDKLTKYFGRRKVVDEISLECRSGKIIGLLGRNGAGKTTTFQMITGLLKPAKGAIFLNEEDLSGCSTHERARKGITYLPQENSVFMKTSVENNIAMILELQNYEKKEIRSQTQSLLEELGLLPLARQSAHSLSGGERRRLEICRSLALNPQFLLLDEPFTGIDPITIKELQKILITLKSKGIGIILSDHNVRDTFTIADKTYIIDNGKILVEGPPQAVAANLQAREKFLGDNFQFGEEIQLSLFSEKGGPPKSLPKKGRTRKNTAAKTPPEE